MKKHRIGVHVEKNAFVDAGEGVISFPSGQVITDNAKQRNGTQYDIASMDLSEYKGQISADHVDVISHVIGEALGLAKREEAVTISGIRFAVKESALAKLAFDLLVGGFPLDLSVETYGPWPDESDDTYYNAKLIGLSVVVVGNNKSATLNELVRNSIEQAKQQGLDTSDAERIAGTEVVPSPPEPVTTVSEPGPVPEPKEQPKEQPKEVPQEQSISKREQEDMKFVTIKNGREFALKVSYKNAAGETVETEPGSTALNSCCGAGRDTRMPC